jgi:pseudouridine-5'-phosphate glycosidase
LHIGLDRAELQALAQTPDAMKLSRADLAFAISEGRTGATTVAATMIAAARGGIHVFATGGIGGVHRKAEESFDISADLEELSRTSVIVVCAGAKAILDVPKTLEVLETKGVPVVTLGQDDFPAFWSRSSGLRSPLRLDSPDRIAGGMLIGNPVPARSEIPSAEMEGHIAQALARAETQGIVGKAVTPFLLASIFEITGGRSLTTNIALVENNARLAAQIAVALARAA